MNFILISHGNFSFITEELLSIRRSKLIFTEHNRVISLQHELDDDQDVPIFELYHKAFYPFQFLYQYLLHQLNQVHEPVESKNE